MLGRKLKAGEKGINKAVHNMFHNGKGHVSNPSKPKTHSNSWDPAAQRRASKRNLKLACAARRQEQTTRD